MRSFQEVEGLSKVRCCWSACQSPVYGICCVRFVVLYSYIKIESVLEHSKRIVKFFLMFLRLYVVVLQKGEFRSQRSPVSKTSFCSFSSSLLTTKPPFPSWCPDCFRDCFSILFLYPSSTQVYPESIPSLIRVLYRLGIYSEYLGMDYGSSCVKYCPYRAMYPWGWSFCYRPTAPLGQGS
jgi:hypothetical protein